MGSPNTLADILGKLEPLPNGCVIWTGFVNDQGYGRVGFQSRFWGVHRLVYEYQRGPIADGLHLHHTCRNRACANVDHLQPTTAREHKMLEDRLTHCKRGHPFVEGNIYTPPSTGGRACKACKRYLLSRWRAVHKAQRQANPRPPQTHCKHGHLFSEANTRIQSHGTRRCITCEKAYGKVYMKAWKARRKETT